jgi:acyl-CoA reductase-like NAD-dependent aldehyde dehydrogenase
MSITTVNPASGQPIATYDGHTDAELEDLLERAHQETLGWGHVPLADRVSVLVAVAAELRARSEELSALVTAEMGKPLTEARAEIEKCAVTAEYYASEAERILADTPIAVDGADAWVAYEPMGLVYAVMPWNFPIWQVMRFALPAIAAGNGVFLKHAPNVTGCALALQSLCQEAGLPTGVFTAIVVEEARVPAVSDRLVADDRIAAVTLTGSNRAGEAIGAAAGRSVKKAVLELGGSDAFVVLADADVDEAARAGVRSRFLNAGQTCICAKRFIVEAAVADEFIQRFLDHTASLVVGDPVDAATNVGPLAREDLRATVISQVDRSVAAGARVLLGGATPSGTGAFFQPTVLLVDGPGVPAFDEEVFGPVAVIVVARDAVDAVRLANQTEFGLGLSIWTADRARGVRLARHVTSGAAFINAMVASDARVPFGGTKRSGFGRELADVGLREFVNVRTYWAAR